MCLGSKICVISSQSLPHACKSCQKFSKNVSKICDTSSQSLPNAAKSCPLLSREVKSSGNRLFSLRMQRRVLQKLASCGAGGTGLWWKRYRGRQSRVRRARRYSSQDTPTTAVEVYSSREFCRLTAVGPRDQTDIIVTGHIYLILHINRHIWNRRGQKTQTWYPRVISKNEHANTLNKLPPFLFV